MGTRIQASCIVLVYNFEVRVQDCVKVACDGLHITGDAGQFNPRFRLSLRLCYLAIKAYI